MSTFDAFGHIFDTACDMGLYDTTHGAQIGEVKGYDALELVLNMAYQQAACGKGQERHASERPFHSQPMQRESDDLGNYSGLVFQVRKKMREGASLPTPERRIQEFLGAINYAAGCIVWELRHARPPAAETAFDIQALSTHLGANHDDNH